MRGKNRYSQTFAGTSLTRAFFKTFLLLSLFSILSIGLVADGFSSEEEALLAREKSEPFIKKSWMSGKYFVSRKRVVSGATVKVMDKKHESVYLTSTDEEGRWRLNNIAEGNYNVEIFKEGFEYVKKENVEIRFPFRTVVELQAIPSRNAIGDIRRWGGFSNKERLQKQGKKSSGSNRILGKAFAVNGDSLLDAEIRLKDFNREVNPLRTFSASDGSFVLEDLPGGLYDLFIMVPGYLPLRIIMDIRADVELTAMLLLQPLNYEATPSELLPSEEPIPPR